MALMGIAKLSRIKVFKSFYKKKFSHLLIKLHKNMKMRKGEL